MKEKKVEEDQKKVEALVAQKAAKEEVAHKAEVVCQAEETTRRVAVEAKRRNAEEVAKKWVSTMLAISQSVLTTTRLRRSKQSRAL